MDRDALGSWLSGPGLPTANGESFGYPGERLGFLRKGLARRRAGDHVSEPCSSTGSWLLALPSPWSVHQNLVANASVLLVLLIFVFEYVVLLATAGRTMGMASSASAYSLSAQAG